MQPQLLADHHIDLSSLHRLNRILLTTDGTLTEILAAYFNDPIGLVKLEEHLHTATSFAWIGATTEPSLERHILLRGTSGTTYVYAVSIVLVDRVAPGMKEALTQTDTPLGRLWLEHRMETFKEIVEVGREPAGDRSLHFGLQPADMLLYRPYLVYVRQQPAIRITEYFPEHGFGT